MENLVIRIFEVLFKMVAVLLITGFMANVLYDVQKLAFNSNRTGLVSLRNINQQILNK